MAKAGARGTRALGLFLAGLAACGCEASQPASTDPDSAAAQADAGQVAEDAGDPNDPPADFLEPSSSSYLTLSFKGLINSLKTVSNDPSNIITGVGNLKTSFLGRTVELTDSDGMYVYQYVYPGDYPDESLRGKSYLVVTGQKVSDDATSIRGTMVETDVHFPTDVALALDGASHELSKLSSSISDAAYVVRKDYSVLYKRCYAAISDAAPRSFLDHSANQTFAPGENLIMWANAPLITDQQTIADLVGSRCTRYQGMACTCYLANATFDCSEWDAEAAKDGTTLSCDPPADFLTPPESGDYATFKFKGLIEPASNPSPQPGYVDATMSVGGRLTTASMFGYATEYDPGTSSNVLYVSFYDEQFGEGGIVTVTQLDFIVTPATLVDAKIAGKDPIVLDASSATTALARTMVAYPSGASYVYRVCPFGVFRPGEAAGSVFDCPAGNTTFGAGERLEIEGKLVLQTDVTEADVGVPLEADGCFCSTDVDLVDCSTLPQS
jgi:hypothetical protein